MKRKEPVTKVIIDTRDGFLTNLIDISSTIDHFHPGRILSCVETLPNRQWEITLYASAKFKTQIVQVHKTLGSTPVEIRLE